MGIKQFIRSFITIGLIALLLASCGGGNSSTGPNDKPQAPKLTLNYSCSSSSCTATFDWTQSDYQAGKNFITHLTLSDASSTVAQKNVTLTSTHGTWSVNNLTPNTLYNISYFTSNSNGNSATQRQQFTPLPGGGPSAPTNVVIKQSCSTQTNCQAPMVTFDQPGSVSGLTTQVTVTEKDQPSQVLATGTDRSLQTSGNQIQLSLTGNPLSTGQQYVATLTTQDNNGKASTPKTVLFQPVFSYGNGAFVYNLGYDLTGSGDNLTSAWQQDFQGLKVSYLYLDGYGNINSVPDASRYGSFTDYYQQTVQTACSAPSATIGLTYYGSANNKVTCASGNAISKAYANWQLNNDRVIRVMPTIETENMNLSSASDQSVKWLADAVAKTIIDDPNAAGVSFDVESVPAAPEKWYAFFAEIVSYLHTNAPSSTSQKSLAFFGNKNVFLQIKNSEGNNLYQLFSSTTNPGCADGRCILILPRYDFGLHDSLLDPLYADVKQNSYAYTVGSSIVDVPASLTNQVLSNNDYFQFAVPASASDNTWASGDIYNFSSAGFSTNSYIHNAGACTDGTAGCVKITQSTPGVSSVTQSNYICDALQSFNILYFGQQTSLCTFIGEPAALAKADGMQKLFLGIAMYRISDKTIDNKVCEGKSNACVIGRPAEMNILQSVEDPSSPLYLINQWTSALTFPAVTSTTSAS